ncbi:hypothetical protein LXT21_11295 [Myxococcus sp. K38C18041901]|uniref:DUF7151 family protein n=1 Tax=Myxococcus guangdongensis TaxID=2906760 RepID=UPI0020A7454D|nr:hypothetical protein [Myxococcus guangdongensis]MCP3059359.1 hypothetical protein [Myxococcus guangdongensis]
MRWTWLALLPLAAGCDALSIRDLMDHPPALNREVVELPGARCELGGRDVLVGTDDNRNGVLDDEEVTGSTLVCARSEAEMRVEQQPVPPGERCPGGGLVTRAGYDFNQNDTLDTEEVAREVYSCRDVAEAQLLTRTRAPPPSPRVCLAPTVLTRVEAGHDEDGDGVLGDDEVRTSMEVCVETSRLLVTRAWEPACAAGGTRVSTGTDLDGDGVLDEEEVLASTPICDDLNTFDGTFVIRGPVDVAVLKGISRIRGGLEVRTGNTQVSEIRLATLEVVDGALFVQDNTSLTRLEFPGLRFIGQGLSLLNNVALESVTVGGATGQFSWVGASLEVAHNPRLQTLDGLQSVVPRSGVVLEDNAQLSHTSEGQGLRAIQTLTGSLRIKDNPALALLPLPNLTSVAQSVLIENNARLTTLEGTRLEFIGKNLEVTNNPALRTLTGLASLHTIGVTLEVRLNAALVDSNGLGALAQVESIFFSRNDALAWWGNMPRLQSMRGTLSLEAHARLVDVRGMESLRMLSWLSLYNNPALTTLTGLEGVERLTGLASEQNSALTSLADLKGLRTLESLMLLDNPLMSELGLPAVQQVSRYFSIQRNPQLPSCRVKAFGERVYTGPGNVYLVAGNNDAATCP